MARPKFSVGMPGVRSLFVALTGSALEAFIAGTWKILMPASGKVVGIGLNVGAVGGTYSTAAIDVTDDTVSILTATFNVATIADAAGTPVQKEGTALAAGAATVAKDSVLAVVATVSGGSSPTWRNATLQIDYVPTGD